MLSVARGVHQEPGLSKLQFRAGSPTPNPEGLDKPHLPQPLCSSLVIWKSFPHGHRGCQGPLFTWIRVGESVVLRLWEVSV